MVTILPSGAMKVVRALRLVVFPEAVSPLMKSDMPNSGHPAHRYQDGTKSFYIQAMWAAGTIQKHFNGDIYAFGKRYNPMAAQNWSDRVSSLITRLKIENGYKLPGTKPAKRPISYP